MREQAEADPRGEGVTMATDSFLGPALAEAVERFFEGDNHWHGRPRTGAPTTGRSPSAPMRRPGETTSPS